MLGNTSLTHILLGNHGTNLNDPLNGIWGYKGTLYSLLLKYVGHLDTEGHDF